ncbi:MAG: hypothetical protein IT581_08795 [Verrucomicrobiales bacterium]|nr:hypothetical protein [Verrucomicrobiales bacterium]
MNRLPDGTPERRWTRRCLAMVGLVLSVGFWLGGIGSGWAATLDLGGPWRVRLDGADLGLREGWGTQGIGSKSTMLLPGTTDLAGLGSRLDTNVMLHGEPFPVTTRFPGVKEPVRADEHGYLVRRFLHVGPAWFEREVEVPMTWDGQALSVTFERVLWRSEVWWDGRNVGTCDSLVGPHRYELGVARPGRHRLTVRVDNRLIHNLSTITHAYGPETQSRWNGLVGALRLESRSPISIGSMRVYPAPDRRSARVGLELENPGEIAGTFKLRLRLKEEGRRGSLADTETVVRTSGARSQHDIELRLNEIAKPWDEFSPIRYRLKAVLEDEQGSRDETQALFGFRQVERAGTELRVNGRRIFLRGTLDCAVYPRTGHPPTTVGEWMRVLGVVKEYGFNHVRFHTWCPPDAAFEAADQLGIYLQAEAPAWVDDWGTETVTRPLGIGRDPEVVAFLRAELRRMSEAYGNHPSFLMCAIGNEFGQQNTDWDLVNRMVEEMKALDPRRLYAGCGARRNLPADDFWYTHQSGAGTRGVGPARTDWDFTAAAESSPVPLIAHETGQRPVFPDYARLLPKFTGPLLPLNLERYRRELTVNGLGDQMTSFVRASARFQLLQYKAEHEGMLRTRGYSGYQLLMLNDFTGQSEALVGILDPFWESKGVIRAAEVRRWNAPSVVLARFPKFVWTADEMFRAEMQVAHHGPGAAADLPLKWELKTRQGRRVASGACARSGDGAEGVIGFGSVSASLNGLHEPTAVELIARWGRFENRWNLWVYPGSDKEEEAVKEVAPVGVWTTRRLDATAVEVLAKGGRVLWFTRGLTNAHAATTGFGSVYWSAGWWGNQFSSLGILCDPRHPLFREFPTDGWSDWQWRDLCAGATTMDLTGAPAGLRPLVQAIPDFHFNRLLGQVFEARVGTGKLLVCGYDLEEKLDQRPAAKQFRRSLLRYVAGREFEPEAPLSVEWLRGRFGAVE